MLALEQQMSDLSESIFMATWLIDWEYMVWHLQDLEPFASFVATGKALGRWPVQTPNDTVWLDMRAWKKRYNHWASQYAHTKNANSWMDMAKAIASK